MEKEKMRVRTEAKAEDEIPITRTLEEALGLRAAFLDETKAWATEEKLKMFHQELRGLIGIFLRRARRLPETPSRGYQPSKEWIAMARSEFDPLSKSWLKIRHLLTVYGRILWRQGEKEPTSWDLLNAEGLFGTLSIVGTGGYGCFIRLRSWLFRRSGKGKKKQAEYEAKRVREKPSKDAEREKKRRYRARKEAQRLPSIMVEYDTPDGLPYVEPASPVAASDEELSALLESV